MNRYKIIFFVICLTAFVACKDKGRQYPEGSIEQAIATEFAEKNSEFREDSIFLKESLDTKVIKDTLKSYLSDIDKDIKNIGDSSIVNVLVPEIDNVCEQINRLLQLNDDSYKLYQISSVRYSDTSYKKPFFALVRNKNIAISEEEPENEFYKYYQDNIDDIKSTIAKITDLANKDHATLIELKNAELKRQEQQRLEAEKAEKERLAEIERNRTPEWDEVATIIKKKTGGRVLGIWESSYSMATVIYTCGGRTYMRHCGQSKDPLSSGYAMRLRKISRNTYQYNEEGSDMPERFVINEYGDLDTYCYNPDGPYGGEWVGMGSYTCVY